MVTPPASGCEGEEGHRHAEPYQSVGILLQNLVLNGVVFNTRLMGPKIVSSKDKMRKVFLTVSIMGQSLGSKNKQLDLRIHDSCSLPFKFFRVNKDIPRRHSGQLLSMEQDGPK
ncbi:hypothetical protein E5288_WYG021670 [Bos mutus]|uniref:Uncharacterized protein n=1 Tax=Bos mutus TaxID=72004 RepID=A0A6B0S729_9CETA|nr:hypothetical protein [Bos mutus]